MEDADDLGLRIHQLIAKTRFLIEATEATLAQMRRDNAQIRQKLDRLRGKQEQALPPDERLRTLLFFFCASPGLVSAGPRQRRLQSLAAFEVCLYGWFEAPKTSDAQ